MLDSIVRTYRSWRNYNEVRAQLSRLSSHELYDIGISRGDIPSIARKAMR